MGGHKTGQRHLSHLALLIFCGASSLIHSVTTQDLSDSHSLAKRQIENRRVVCYYANWAVYRQGTAKFTPQNINPYLCTHLIYAFAGLGKDDTIQTFDKYQDLEKGGYGQFAALKTYNRDLKTLIAIGGWNEGSRRFSPLVADPERRKTFIRSALKFLRQYNFDGLDLDWEYPSFRDGGKPEDRHNYAKFVVEMRQAFESEAKQTGKPRLLITMAVPASLEYAGKGFDIATLDKHLDFFNLLTYDYHSAYEPATNHHSPLYKPRDWSEFDFRVDLNIDATIQFYIKSGASRDKLVLGIPTYGRSYTLVNPDAHEIGSPTDGPGEAGKGTKEDGYLAYYEVCQSVQDEDGWEVETPYPGVMGPYAHKGKFWVGFDDEYIVREKAHFVNEESLGGIMFWTIDNDDFRGACGARPFPLIEAAKEALYGKDAAIRTATSVSISTSEQTRIEMLKLSREQLAELASRPSKTTSVTSRPSSGTTSLEFDPLPFDPFSTPEPPTTPSSAPAYECKDEGFFPHTSSCKKYFWCLDVPGSGMVAHTFTCPQGLYFNSLTDGCDFRRNVDCDGKDEKEEDEPQTTSATTQKTTEAGSASTKSNGGEPETLEEVLEAIKEAGGLDAFEEKLRLEEEEREAAKRREEERRAEISKKTRSRLSELLDRKRAEVMQELESDDQKATKSSSSSAFSRPPITLPTAPPTTSASTIPSRIPPPTESSRRDLLARLAEKRKATRIDKPVTRTSDDNDVDEESTESPESSESSTSSSLATTVRSNLFRNRSRFNLNRGSVDESTAAPEATSPRPSATQNILRGRERFRNLLTRTTTPPSSLENTQFEQLNAETEPPKVELLGFASEDESGEPAPLRLNRFRPEAGIRNRLRSRLHEVLEDETLSEDGSTNDSTASTRTNSNNSPNIASIRQRNPALSNSEAAAATERPSSLRKNVASISNRGPPPSAIEEDDEDSSTLKPLEYVTIDRGSASRGGAEEGNQFVTPLPGVGSFQIVEESEEKEDQEEIPKSGLQGGVRNLEYVTIQRGRGSASDEAEAPIERPDINQFGGDEDNNKLQIKEEPAELELGDRFLLTTTFRASPAVPQETTTPPPNLRASLLFLTNPNLIEDEDVFEDTVDTTISNIEPASSTFRPTFEDSQATPNRPVLSATRLSRPTFTSTFRPVPAVADIFDEEPVVQPQDSVVTGLDAFNSLDPVTERLRPEEELFNSVFQTQFDTITRPRTDPLLERPQSPRRRLPETPRRLEQPAPVRELPPRPNLPNRDPALRSRQRQPLLQAVTQRVHPFSTTTDPSSSTPFPIVTLPQFTAVAAPVQPVARPRAPVRRPVISSTTPTSDIEYANYDYDKYDDYDSSPALVSAIGDYDLNPLTSKVEILDNGKPVCHDVGVFPHPGSCRKFITCSMRAIGSGVVGWVYECPSYLAFDPVGGRCNWANEFVCAERH